MNPGIKSTISALQTLFLYYPQRITKVSMSEPSELLIPFSKANRFRSCHLDILLYAHHLFSNQTRATLFSSAQFLQTGKIEVNRISQSSFAIDHPNRWYITAHQIFPHTLVHLSGISGFAAQYRNLTIGHDFPPQDGQTCNSHFYHKMTLVLPTPSNSQRTHLLYRDQHTILLIPLHPCASGNL